MTMAKYDWEAIEREYRMGHKTLRTLSVEFGPHPSNISRQAKKHGWVQDKTQEVRERTRAALIEQNATGDGDARNKKRNNPTPEDIDRQVRTNISVIRDHRSGIKKGMGLVSVLSDQLKDVAQNREEYEGQIVQDTEPAAEGDRVDLKRRNAMLRAISLPANAGTLRDLSTALKNFVALERQAYNLDEAGSEIDNVKVNMNF
jgi:hypothetical protein